MVEQLHEAVRSRAIEWHLRLKGDDADWTAFEEWLAADPEHGAAFDRIQQLDADIEPLLQNLVFREAANDAEDDDHDDDVPAPAKPRKWWLVTGVVAACSLAAVALAPVFAPARYEVVTRPGENQIVSLDQGTRIILNGSTRMVFNRKNRRFAELASGEALFQVRHDASHPFVVEIGDNRVEDAGTVFNIVREANETRVAVAEGKVVFNPGRGETPLVAGEGLVADSRTGSVRIGQAATSAIGGWQRGQLVYLGDPLSRVAADLSRALGLKISVTAAVASRPFYGTIATKDFTDGRLERLGTALGVTIERNRQGWVMKNSDAP